MPSTFTIVTETPFPVEALFDVSLDIDAHVESMARSAERAVAGVTTGRIALGETVTWRARHFGIWFTMTSKITALERPVRFVDQQVRGPFALFVHEHVFEPAGAGPLGAESRGPEPQDAGSRMTDRITVGSPVFGRLAERLILVPYLRRLITARNAHLIERLR